MQCIDSFRNYFLLNGRERHNFAVFCSVSRPLGFVDDDSVINK